VYAAERLALKRLHDALEEGGPLRTIALRRHRNP
jgi:hypothetical protein